MSMRDLKSQGPIKVLSEEVMPLGSPCIFFSTIYLPSVVYRIIKDDIRLTFFFILETGLGHY